MQKVLLKLKGYLVVIMPLIISSCASYHGASSTGSYHADSSFFSSRLPDHLQTREKLVLVDPNVHRWGAYDSKGDLVREGLATAGNHYCEDIGRACKTPTGSFRVWSLGSYNCKSSKYPLPRGGGLMPYCMYFGSQQALHGSPDGAVVEGNISHGCVRLKIPDAEWLRYNFVNIGTKVVVKSY